MDTLIKPFHNSILDLTNALQVGEVFLKFVAIRSHALKSIIVSDVFLVGELLEEARLPLYGIRVDNSHQGHYRDRDLDKVLSTDRNHRN